MCFALADVDSLRSCFIAARLSTMSGIGSSTGKRISSSSWRKPSNSRQTCDSAVNSASIVESATPPCFLHTHRIGIPSSSTTPPVTLLRSVLSAAKSASLNPSSRSAAPGLQPFIRSLTLFEPLR
ncbi:hypothetical protein PHYSODRAFT_479395 [Phytophthora sojae]|uniref:Uncharacterized protein n=1 Tax=Phytophthora sojae (strain P6497) TaxID=1094619 RepID=G4YXR0_PHYSP|nr:hypothetical protein PHYSODRAFT_479395 [Phytophthora sojae]EGZ25053.1 hypothetical protein PHYSODRAFT_479395 [Phytophthora sojae]|eukprot:XP_009520341.1 hypothetical protein PHYSODRAFT_479395 [Phytophthora sojae]